jgi:polysaccharide export outer membrane protein
LLWAASVFGLGAQQPEIPAEQPAPPAATAPDAERAAKPASRPSPREREREGAGPNEAVPKPTPQAYVLVPSDLILVEVFQEPDLTVQRRLNEKGMVDLPLLGRLSIGGRTIEQATTLIHDALEKDYLVKPRVNVTVLDHAKWKFTVMGQVFKPGPYEVSAKDRITLVDAIAMAGGPTPKGNLKRVTISRPAGGGRNETLNLDADEMRKGASPSFEVLSGDTISVAEKVF